MGSRQLAVFCLAVYFSVMAASSNALEPLSFADIDGWADDDLDAALEPFRMSCEVLLEGIPDPATPVLFAGKKTHWQDVCRNARQTADGRGFFESTFRPFRVIDPVRPQGLFTGYYEPEIGGRRSREQGFEVPLYGKPHDLVAFDDDQKRIAGVDYGRMVNGRPQPYFTRQQIETGALAGRDLEIAWVSSRADAFFLQIQGSGRIRLADGSVLRIGYAAKSGHPYTSIGAKLAERGLIPREEISMQAIRTWMASDEQAARLLMWENASFVFFREMVMGRPELGPVGAGRVQLVPQRSIAVDRSVWMLGTPVWLAADVPMPEQDAPVPFRKLLIAQDTGSAIRGMARGDVFWGSGPSAAHTAGHMQSPGTMIVLLPNRLADALDLMQ